VLDEKKEGVMVMKGGWVFFGIFAAYVAFFTEFSAGNAN